MSLLQKTLSDVQLRLSLVNRRQLTHKDLAVLAHASPRALGEWMRGTTEPTGMTALLHLLSELPLEQVSEVLAYWRDTNLNNTDASSNGAAQTRSH